MTESPEASHRSLACRDLGFPCEWEIRSAPTEELERRFREHYRCAHGGTDPPADVLHRLGPAMGEG